MSLSGARHRRCGFTILELMVTCGIVILLLVILLPALGVAHRAAQRTLCQNNLKQIGIALVNYHETFDAFPPGYVARNVLPADGGDLDSGPGYAWGALLLDFLDQSPMAMGVDFDLDATHPANTSTMATGISFLFCPTSQTPRTFDVTAGLTPYILGSSNYVGMYGIGDLTARPGQPEGAGAFYRNSYTTMFRIRDGLSNTILIAERASWHDFDQQDAAGVPANSAWFASVPGADRPAGIRQAPMRKVGPASLVLGTLGLGDAEEGFLRPNHTNHIGSFSSLHEGGLHGILGDASVRFLHEDIDEDTFRSLAQHSDQSPAGDF